MVGALLGSDGQDVVGLGFEPRARVLHLPQPQAYILGVLKMH